MTQTQTELLTVPEVAQRLRLDPATVRRMITSGKLPAIKAGRQYRVEASQVQLAIDSWRTSTPLTLQPGVTGR